MKLNYFNILIILGIVIFGFLSFLFGKLPQLCFFILLTATLGIIADKSDNYNSKIYFVAVIATLILMTFVLSTSFDLNNIMLFIFPILGA